MILYRKAVKMCTYDSILHHGPEHCFLYHLIRSLYLVNPFSAKDVLIDFTLSNARRFYASKGNPLALKGLKNYLPQPFQCQGRTYRFYSV